MVKVKEFYNSLREHNVTFFTGVPDSLLKDFCAYASDNAAGTDHVIAANEGNALALATGHHLATGKFGLVYMQNSGLGNAINPLTSLVDPQIYSIPLLLLIGWRGEPGFKDEPQHVKMGQVTLPILDALGIPHKVLDDNFKGIIDQASNYIKKNSSPFSIVVRAGTFEKYDSREDKLINFEMSREQAIAEIVKSLGHKDIIVSTTGKTSRELFECRQINNLGHNQDFLTVGSMGHSSSIALGIALAKPNRQVYCLDGDGALIMHLGSLSVIAQLKATNFKHIVINNFVHDSVGGQPTAAITTDIPAIAKAAGYIDTFSVSTRADLIAAMKKIKAAVGPILLEVKVNKGARKDLGRPSTTPIQNKELFMHFLKD